jgi:hypothetical protein
MLSRTNIVECEDANWFSFSTNDAISTILLRAEKWETRFLQPSPLMSQEVEKPYPGNGHGEPLI